MANNTWSAAGASTWNINGNWSDGAVPDVTDDVIFDGTSTFACTIDVSPSVNSVTIAAAYTGNWTMAGQTLTVALGFSCDGIGTANLGNGLTANGAASTVHFGAGMGATTATSCVLTMNGTTGMTLDDDKGVTFKSLTLGAAAVVTSSGGANSTVSGAATVATFTNGGTLTLNKAMVWNVTAAVASVAILGAAPTINGNSVLYIWPSANTTIPALTTTGTLAINIKPFAGSPSVTLAGVLSCLNGVSIYNNTVNSFTFNQAGFAITAASLDYGASNAAATFTANFNGVLDINGAVNGTLYNLGTININFGTSTWNVAGNWTYGNAFTVAVGTSAITIDNTSTITSAGKSFYDLTFAPGAAKTVTLADALDVDGDLTITNGTLATAGFAVTVDINFACNGTSTYSGNGAALTVGANFTVAAGATWTINAAASLTFNGAAGTQQVTTNAKVMAATTHNGAGGTVQLQDAFSCGTTALTLTAGAWDSNGQNITCGAFTWNSNDAGTTLDGPIAASGNLVRGAAAAGFQASTITINTNSVSITSNGGQWGPIASNPGVLNTVTLIDIFSTYGNLTITTGTWNCAGFACTVGVDFAVAGTSTFNATAAPCIFAGDYTVSVAATVTSNAATAYLFTGIGGTITTGGINLPGCQFTNDYSINGSCTARRLAWLIPGVTLTMQAGDTFTLTTFAAADWSGAAGFLNTFRSSVAGTPFTFVLPNAAIVDHMDVQDCILIGFAVTANDGTSVTQGGNTGWDFGFVLMAVAYAGGVLTVVMDAAGVNQYPVSEIGYRLTGPGLFTAAAITAWADNGGAGTAVLAPGTYDIQCISSDGALSAILVGGLVVGGNRARKSGFAQLMVGNRI